MQGNDYDQNETNIEHNDEPSIEHRKDKVYYEKANHANNNERTDETWVRMDETIEHDEKDEAYNDKD